MTFETQVKVILKYCQDTIGDWDERLTLALAKIDMYHAPLEQVDSVLYDEIQDAIVDCINDYELYYDTCVEDVIFN